jgi:hypothetical protein
MPAEHTLEGWGPPEETNLIEVIDAAFDYRGDVTVVRKDGQELVGYVFNRNSEVADPFIQMFPAGHGDVITIAYADIRTIRFTGRDTATGDSYAAWLRRREVAKASREDA